MKMPFHDCPRFNSCNINKCPLDPFMSEKENLEDESDCPMEKGVRLRLGKDLPWLGLKPRELQAKRRWDALTTEQQEAIRQRTKVNFHSLSKTP